MYKAVEASRDDIKQGRAFPEQSPFLLPTDKARAIK
jgi:hypothetical protein